MSVVFNAVIKIDENEKWFIELTDTVDGRVKICKDLDEFATNVEELGQDYGGHVDEVQWSKDDDVPPFIIDEIRIKMAEQRAKIEEQTGEPITPYATKKEE